MNEEKYKIKKWMYFIPVSIQGLWTIWMYPIYALVNYVESLFEKEDEIIYIYHGPGNFFYINLFVIIVTVILSIIIGKKFKKADCKINSIIKLITICSHIILVILNLLVYIMATPI